MKKQAMMPVMMGMMISATVGLSFLVMISTIMATTVTKPRIASAAVMESPPFLIFHGVCSAVFSENILTN